MWLVSDTSNICFSSGLLLLKEAFYFTAFCRSVGVKKEEKIDKKDDAKKSEKDEKEGKEKDEQKTGSSDRSRASKSGNAGWLSFRNDFKDTCIILDVIANSRKERKKKKRS